MRFQIKQLRKPDSEITFFEPGKVQVGVDVGSRAVKVCALKETPGGTKLLGLGLAEIAVSSGAAEDVRQQNVFAAISTALAQIPLRVKPVISVLHQASSLSIKNLSLPAMPDEELRESVKWELEQNISFPVEQAQIDFVISGESVRSGAKNYEIEAVAVTNEDVQAHLLGVSVAPAAVQAITVAPFALWSVFQKSNQWAEEHAIALVDMGAVTTKITVFQKHTLRFSREIFFGSEVITQTLAQNLGLEESEAEQLKIQHGLDDATPYYEPLSEALAELAAELDRSFGYYKAQFHLERIDRVVLYGGGSALKNLSVFLSERLGIFCEIGSPFDGILFEKKAFDNFEEFAAFFPLAIGAALSGGDVKAVNLLPAELRRQTTFNLKQWLMRAVPVLLLAVMALVYGYLRFSVDSLKRLQHDKELIIEEWKQEQALRVRQDFFAKMRSTQECWQSVLKGISTVIPEGVVLNSLEFDGRAPRVVLTGESQRNVLVLELVRKLEPLPYIKQVTLQSAGTAEPSDVRSRGRAPVPPSTGSTGIDFHIIVTIENEPKQ